VFADGALRTATHRLGLAALLGHCLATDEELRIALDAALVHGRPDSLARLRGSYTVVLLTADRLLAMTDLAGQFPLFYRPAGPDTVVSSGQRSLTSGAVDLLVAAAQIVGLNSEELLPGRSSFTDVACLSAGRALEVTDAGAREWTYRYLDDGERLDLQEGGVLLREVLDDAVRARMFGAERPTADLTGGYDSPAIALRASRYGRLDVFTRHYPAIDAGDVIPARVLAARNRWALVHHEVESTATELPYCGLPDAIMSDAPCRLVKDSAVLKLRTAVLAEMGSDMHMTGYGGDALFAPSSVYLADLARKHQFGRLRREATGRARGREIAAATVLRDAVGLALGGYGRQLIRLRATLADGRRQWSTEDGVDGWRLWGPSVGWLTPGVRRDLANALYPRKMEELRLGGMGFADRTALIRIRRGGQTLREWSQLTGGVVPVHAPYLDGPVVRTVLRTPAPERAIPYKALLCVAMADVPSWQPPLGSANYIEEFHLGLRHAMPALLALMENPRLADLRVIEPAPVRDAIRDAVAGHHHSLGLDEIVAWELWLRGLS
jgi:asparagine synthase (glutamine-hydrolysing)